MTNALKMLAVALTVGAVPVFSGAAVATPMSMPLALQSAAQPSTETVQYRRGYRRGYGGAGLGIVAGALIGGAIIGATQPYGYRRYGPDYAYGPGYAYEPGYRQGYVAVGPGGGDEVAYCAQRFRSYDPGSGTYLGFDGLRHPCP